MLPGGTSGRVSSSKGTSKKSVIRSIVEAASEDKHWENKEEEHDEDDKEVLDDLSHLYGRVERYAQIHSQQAAAGTDQTSNCDRMLFDKDSTLYIRALSRRDSDTPKPLTLTVQPPAIAKSTPASSAHPNLSEMKKAVEGITSPDRATIFLAVWPIAKSASTEEWHLLIQHILTTLLSPVEWRLWNICRQNVTLGTSLGHDMSKTQQLWDRAFHELPRVAVEPITFDVSRAERQLVQELVEALLVSVEVLVKKKQLVARAETVFADLKAEADRKRDSKSPVPG